MFSPNFRLILSCFLSISISKVVAQGRLDRPTFFRDGQLQMEQEIQRLQQQQQNQEQQPSTELEHPSQLLTIDQGQLRWQKYLFKDGGFSVWMPEGIKSQETITLNLGSDNLSFEVLATQPPNYRFVCAYSDPLSPSQLTDSAKLLSLIRDGIVAQTKFTLINDRPTSWKQYPGLELTMTAQDELISFRIYLINNLVYILAAGQQNKDSLSPEIVSFFDSFRLWE